MAATQPEALLIQKADPHSPMTRVRWWIVLLLFTATTINYIDRQILGVLKPTLMKELFWDESDFANIVFSFQCAYAVGLLAMGRFIDRVGVRIGLALAVLGWSVAAGSHAAASGLLGFMTARFALGITEAGNFPACVRAVADWFPRKERAFATGLFNSGSNVGAVLTPLTIPYITAFFGWRAAFIVTGCIGFFWLVWWWFSYHSPDKHPRANSAELAHIRSDQDSHTQNDPRPSLASLLSTRPTWGFMVGKFLTDPIWWFYLFWIPGWLWDTYKLDLKTMGMPLATIYIVSDLGSIIGGWISSKLIQKGWSANAARKVTMLGCALAVLPVFSLPWIVNLWTAVAIISLATAAHQAWSANIFTIVGDTQPRPAVASVVGLGGTAGAVGGMLIAKFAGFILSTTGSYIPLFAICASAYLVALLVIQLLIPRLDQQVFKGRVDGGAQTEAS